MVYFLYSFMVLKANTVSQVFKRRFNIFILVHNIGVGLNKDFFHTVKSNTYMFQYLG